MLTATETSTLEARFDAHGAERLEELVITLDRDALASWLRAEDAQ